MIVTRRLTLQKFYTTELGLPSLTWAIFIYGLQVVLSLHHTSSHPYTHTHTHIYIYIYIYIYILAYFLALPET